MFHAKNDWALNPDLPVLSPWKTVTPINTADVDAGAQSVQRLRGHGGQPAALHRPGRADARRRTSRCMNLRAIAGEYDYASRHIDLGKLPVFIENQQKGNYKVHLDPGDYCDLIIKFNLNYDADAEIGEVVQHRRLPARALARHQPRSDQRDVLARHGHARLRRAGGQQQVQPGAAVPEAVVHARREEGQRDAGQDRARPRRTRRATGCAPTARAGCASRS